jgi:hypothetical protein
VDPDLSSLDLSSAFQNKYILVQVNIDQVRGFQLKNQFDINKLPTLLIFGSDGRLHARIEQRLNADDLAQVLLQTIERNRPVIHQQNTSPSHIFQQQKHHEAGKGAGMTSLSNKERMFQLQLGVYSTFEGTKRMVAELKDALSDSIVIQHDYKGNRVIYRILTGHFSTLSAAEAHRKFLKEIHGIDSFIHM